MYAITRCINKLIHVTNQLTCFLIRNSSFSDHPAHCLALSNCRFSARPVEGLSVLVGDGPRTLGPPPGAECGI